MPLRIPTLDDRRYQDLLNEALARIPVHTPEWTNFNESDPGVTLVELFAFLTENLLYRSNQIPERNRRKFLSLLGVPLQPASPARGLVTFVNDRGPLQTVTLNDDLEVRAGQIPFRTDNALDVLPIETQIYFKRKLDEPTPSLLAYYNQLYASYKGRQPDTAPVLYETVPLTPRIINAGGIDLGRDTIDHSLWIALFVRTSDKPYTENIDVVRQAIAGKTLSIGIVPVLTNGTQQLSPIGQTNTAPHLQYAIPKIPTGGKLPDDVRFRVPQYLPLDANTPTYAPVDVLAEPGVVEVTLPAHAEQLALWSNLDPLEAGVGDFPPTLEDTPLNERLITWLRISAPNSTRLDNAQTPASLQVKLLWVSINTVTVKQQAYIANELLPASTGEPDQSIVLSKTPVIGGSVQLTVTTNGKTEIWQEIDDLLSAGAEVPVSDLRLSPGVVAPSVSLAKVFTLNPESGELRFGDGAHGARPPFSAILRANYAYSVGPDGNVSAGSISASPALPPGFKVFNPVRTWGGAEAESVAVGEKQIARYLQHRDRLVTVNDFETITLRTPGVDIGRVEVLPAYNPDLFPNTPGDAAGAVTLMVIPRYDPVHPEAPTPDRIFLDTIAAYLDPRRLLTTEIFLRGPVYKHVWVSVGIKVVPGASIVQVREAVKAALASHLSPLPTSTEVLLDSQVTHLLSPQNGQTQRGWPLRKPVLDLELLAVASRVEGVLLINNVLLSEGTGLEVRQIAMDGLELPYLAGMAVTVGEPLSLDQVRGQDMQSGQGSQGGSTGQGGSGSGGQGSPGSSGGKGGPPPPPPMPPFAPLPATPEECK